MVFKTQFGKKVGRSSSSLQQRCQNIQIFSIFDNKVTISEPFRKFTSMRKPIGSGLKRVVTGSVSERYQTSLCAQLSKKILEKINIFSDLICEIFNIQKPPSKITRYGVNIPKENVFAVSHVGRKPENDPKSKMQRGIFHNHENSSVPKDQK